MNKFVIERLSEGWTPEQISGWLKEGNEKGLCAIAFETIYSSSIAPRRKRRSYGNISSAIIINEKSNAQELHVTELKNANPSMIGQNTSITAQHSAIVILSSAKGAAPSSLSMREKAG